jgi:exodeoxyribonuclease VII large subunit
MIDIIHPANTIKRGFSITRASDGRLVKSVGSVQPREELMTEVADGVIASVVEHVQK